MIETKNKTVTVESLNALHEHGKSTYMTKLNPSGSGTMSMNGDALISGALTIGTNIRLVPSADSLSIEFLDENEIVQPTNEVVEEEEFIDDPVIE